VVLLREIWSHEVASDRASDRAVGAARDLGALDASLRRNGGSRTQHARGVQGQAVDLIVVDAGPTWRSAAESARVCVDEEAVDAIVGMLPSYPRSPVAFAIDGRAPFI
jgi:hypothetical protein